MSKSRTRSTAWSKNSLLASRPDAVSLEKEMPFRPASTALQDLLVLDLTRVRAGPTCARELADWGANVIKIDAREEGGSDGSGPSDFSARHDPDFQNLHRNKRAMSLDLKHKDGIAIFRRL